MGSIPALSASADRVVGGQPYPVRIVGADLHLDVYGLAVAVDGWPDVIEDLRLDFAWFAPSHTADQRIPDLRVHVEERAPDFDSLPDLAATMVTPRNVVYHDGSRTIADYSGRAVAVFDRPDNSLTVQGEERHLVHEIVYLFVLSRVGEHLDARGLMRLHALGLVGAQGALTMLMPAGGGKSTLAMRALNAPGVQLLSDDTPLLDREANVHPFPLRIGIGAVAAETLPADHVRRIERLEYPAKYVVAIDAFRDQIASGPQPLAHIVIAQRRLGRGADLKPLSRRAAVGPLLRDGVIGLGVAQMVEWTLAHGVRDLAGKVGTAASRAACCRAALSRAKTWQLEIGLDHERNWEALSALLR